MKTLFLLMAQYDGQVIIPVDTVCADYFSHLSPKNLRQNIAHGKIDLPLVQMDSSRQAARGVHINDLAQYIDKQREAARSDHEKLWGRK